ncbi:MAG: ribonuclease III [Alphaproteobacteria bacterium]|nr:ribonuclease III [Alphaproteobacteria bacterium]
MAGYSKVSTPSDKQAALEAEIGYKFKNGVLLDMALTHSSLPKSQHNNERLEFLGDRVLGLAIAELLYKTFPNEREGDLAKRLTAVVQQAALAEVAEGLKLSNYVRLSVGEIKAGGSKKDAIMSDAVEALIGAIYLDGGYDPASRFVRARWEPMLATFNVPPEDAKTRLQEWAQSRGLPLPEYVVIARAGEDHKPQFDVEVRVKGLESLTASSTSKRGAEKAAAAKMLARIDAGTNQ